MERPKELESRELQDITPQELASLNEQRNQARVKADEARWELRSPLHWFENLDFATAARGWSPIRPTVASAPDAAGGHARRGAGGGARRPRPADSYKDRSLFDRCISRGVPGSMMPAIYGNSYDVTQGTGVVAIRYEMIHETRVIPLGDAPHARRGHPFVHGRARGRFEGATLVVETRNMHERVATRRQRATEAGGAFHTGGAGTARIVGHARRPDTWSRPWTFAMRLTQVPASQPPFEYACHEGNYAMFNLLSITRAEGADSAPEPAALEPGGAHDRQFPCAVWPSRLPLHPIGAADMKEV